METNDTASSDVTNERLYIFNLAFERGFISGLLVGILLMLVGLAFRL